MRRLIYAGLVVMLASFAVAGQSEWRKITTTDECVIYYHPASIIQDKPGTFRVWMKAVPLDLVKERKKWNKTEPGKYDNYAYGLTLWGIRCASRQSNMIEGDYFTKDGDMIDTDIFSSKWTNILPESPLDDLLKLVCPK
jgi:hypothetical protein